MVMNNKKGWRRNENKERRMKIKDETHKDQEKIKNESIKINDKTHKEKNEITLVKKRNIRNKNKNKKEKSTFDRNLKI